MASLAEKISKLSDAEVAQSFEVNSLGYWCLQNKIILEGTQFAFEGHEYLYDLYFDTSPNIVVQKAAQVGFSTYAILRAIHGCLHLYDKGVLYLFPSRDDVTDFSKARFNLILDQNEILKQAVMNTDAANIKRIGNNILYLRGTRSRTGLKSIPVDLIVFDERDEMEERQTELARFRVAHSRFKHFLDISTPSVAEWGINKIFRLSDQKQWFLKCQKCGEDTCLEIEFPSCIEMRNGRYVRVCKKCGHEIRPKDGRWIIQNPGSSISGYHISQLNSMFVNLDELMEKYRSGENMEEFYHNALGQPYIEGDRRLEIKDILALCGWHSIRLGDSGPCSMGIDQGKKLHVVIGKKKSDTLSEIVHIGCYDDWQKIYELMRDFRVLSCVVDGLPETDEAKRFAFDHPGRVYLRMSYSKTPMGGIRWDDINHTVSCFRTEILDTSHNQVIDQKITLPRKCQEIEEFARQSHMIVKVIQEDDKGEKKPLWKSVGPDHYRHAFAFECMARSRITAAVLHQGEYESVGYKPFDPIAGY